MLRKVQMQIKEYKLCKHGFF